MEEVEEVEEVEVEHLLVGVLCAGNKYTNSFCTFHATDVHLCENHTSTHIYIYIYMHAVLML